MKKLFIIFVVLVAIAAILVIQKLYVQINQDPPGFDEYKIEDIIFTNDNDASSTTYEMIQDEIDDSVMTSNVLISNINFSSVTTMFILSKTWYGSGVIFYETERFYYLLTNSHVVEDSSDYLFQIYRVTDYYGDTYRAFEYEGSNDANLDLSILVFQKRENELHVMTIVDAKAPIGEDVIAIGNPERVINVITLGAITNYEQVNSISDDGTIKIHDFEALQHTAETKPGSSGGMLINYDLNIVGINFASRKSRGSTVTSAIPSCLICDYLEMLI